MNRVRESHGALWGVVVRMGCILGVVFSGLGAEQASAAAPSPDADRAALIWLRITTPAVESQTHLLRSDLRFVFDIQGEVTGPTERSTLTIQQLIEMRSPARLSLSPLAARASISGVEVASSDATGFWAAMALRLLHRLSDDATDPDEVASAEFEGRRWYAPSIRSAPRRMKDLFIGTINRRWDDPNKDFLPNPYPERYSVYPTPGAAGLALIAGGCVLGRRRR